MKNHNALSKAVFPTALVILTVASIFTTGNLALSASRTMCETAGWVVVESQRKSWWRCCTVAPQGVVRNDYRELCFECKGESENVNCDQLPQMRPLANPVTPSHGSRKTPEGKN